jgi:hypothetical protein
MILVFNSPSNPYQFWTNHRDSLTEDYLYKKRQLLNDPTIVPDEQAYDCGILDLEDDLQGFGFSLVNYSGFVLPSVDVRNSYTGLLTEEQNLAPRVLREQFLLNALTNLEAPQTMQFNDDQQQVFNQVTELVQSDDGLESKVVFVDGPGGTGKTFLFNALLDSVRRTGGIALAVAASGTAALLLKGGKTAHSAFKIPLEVDHSSLCSIRPISPLANLIRRTKLIIWDEAPMISRDVLETVDRTFKEICKVLNPAFEHLAFGGRVMVLVATFVKSCLSFQKHQSLKL